MTDKQKRDYLISRNVYPGAARINARFILPICRDYCENFCSHKPTAPPAPVNKFGIIRMQLKAFKAGYRFRSNEIYEKTIMEAFKDFATTKTNEHKEN